jgi:hypothetical protein
MYSRVATYTDLFFEFVCYRLEEPVCPRWEDESSDGSNDDTSNNTLCDILENGRPECRSERHSNQYCEDDPFPVSVVGILRHLYVTYFRAAKITGAALRELK